MSDVVSKFRASLSTMSNQDKREALKVIEEQIAANMQNLQEAVRHVEEGLTRGYKVAWRLRVANLQADVIELENVKQLLS
jgi:hypothetical protein